MKEVIELQQNAHVHLPRTISRVYTCEAGGQNTVVAQYGHISPLSDVKGYASHFGSLPLAQSHSSFILFDWVSCYLFLLAHSLFLPKPYSSTDRVIEIEVPTMNQNPPFWYILGLKYSV